MNGLILHNGDQLMIDVQKLAEVERYGGTEMSMFIRHNWAYNDSFNFKIEDVRDVKNERSISYGAMRRNAIMRTLLKTLIHLKLT
jgi:hypothetical protein